jgi:hypothetical protein
VFVVVVVVAEEVGRLWDPIRRAEGSAVLRSAHCCGGGCEGGAGGAVSKGLGLGRGFGEGKGERPPGTDEATRGRGKGERRQESRFLNSKRGALLIGDRASCTF